MGGLLTGLSGQGSKGKERFEAFFKMLGPDYAQLLSDHGKAVYADMRSGLAHNYFVARRATIHMTGQDLAEGQWSSNCAIHWAPAHIHLVVQKYFDDFRKAVWSYHGDLVVRRQPDLLDRFREATQDMWAFQEGDRGT